MIKVVSVFLRIFICFSLLSVLELYSKTVRRCALDIGSGEHKMQIADVDTETNRIIDTIAYNVKKVGLANDFIQNGDLSTAVQDLSKQAFKELLQEALDLGAQEFGGIATAVFRKAPSGKRLLEDLKSEGKKLVNGEINLEIVNQRMEGETGYLTAVVLSPEFQKDSIVSWDSGNASFQIVMHHNKSLDIFEGPSGTTTVTKDIVEKVRKIPFTSSDPINPVKPQELQELISYLLTTFNFPDYLIDKIAQKDTKVVGIGGQTSLFGLGAIVTGKDTFTAQEIYSIVSAYSKQLLDNNSQELLELDPSSPATTIVRLILLYAVMDALHIREVIYKKSMGNTPGILISSNFWS